MAQHRGYTRKKFVEAVGDEYMQRYFVEHAHLEMSDGELTEDAVATLIERQSDFDQRIIDEELRCINDVAEKGMDYLDKASRDFGTCLDDGWPRERVSMHLFLENPLAFRTAYDWYLYRTASNSLSHHQFTNVNADFADDLIEEFRRSIESWYGDQSKGRLCEVRTYKEDDARILIIAHGDYPHAQPVWDNGGVKTSIYRPAKEDVLRFTPDNSVLSVKLSGRSNAQREHYIRSFGKCFLRLDEVPDETLSSTTVSLEPIRTGQFDYCQWGKGSIEWVQLTEIELELEEIGATIKLRCSDVLTTVRDHLNDFNMQRGKLRFASLKYQLNYDGAPARPIPVDIRPPQRTNFNRKRDAEIIEAHLRENGVLLV